MCSHTFVWLRREPYTDYNGNKYLEVTYMCTTCGEAKIMFEGA